MSESTLTVDLLAPEVNDDPYPYFAALREQDPVHWSDRHRGWIITRYDDCTRSADGLQAPVLGPRAAAAGGDVARRSAPRSARSMT